MRWQCANVVNQVRFSAEVDRLIQGLHGSHFGSVFIALAPIINDIHLGRQSSPRFREMSSRLDGCASVASVRYFVHERCDLNARLLGLQSFRDFEHCTATSNESAGPSWGEQRLAEFQ